MKHNVISQSEYEILVLWCVEGETQATIADKLGTYQKDVSRKIKAIQSKCQWFIEDNYEDTKELFDCIAYMMITKIPKGKRKDAGSPKYCICYPSEYLMKVSMTGKWYKGKYRLKNRCIVPEFLSECFGDNDTKCTLCWDDFGGTTCSRI